MKGHIKAFWMAARWAPRWALKTRHDAKMASIAIMTTVVAMFGAASSLAQPAWAQGSQQCWSGSYDHDMDTIIATVASYDAEFRWCATNGIVNTFIVDKAYVVAKGPARDAKIDIQPYTPLRWGPTYNIYLNVTAQPDITGGTLSYKGTSLTGLPGQYQDYWDITLHGDGTITGTLNKTRN